jgi:membrane protein DedA with SNARE-associated domain
MNPTLLAQMIAAIAIALLFYALGSSAGRKRSKEEIDRLTDTAYQQGLARGRREGLNQSHTYFARRARAGSGRC